MIKTIGFPGRYLQGPDAVQHLPELLKEFSLATPLVLMDDLVRASVGDLLLQPLSAAGIKTTLLRFAGECTSEAIEQLALEAEQTQADVVIGYGGGKTIDAAKGIAKAHNLRLFIVPTIASNDSPTSRLIVLYDDQHRVTRVDRLTRNPDVVLVDTAIIARAPARFFAAGLGDALSKKFEATQCHLARGKNFFGTESLATARLLAEHCYETIIEFGLPALKRIQEHRTPDESVERAVEASVLLSGLGFESGGLSLSHALTRGFSAHPVMSTFLHGETVAFGSIVQLVAEERAEAEVQAHIDFCHSLGLPITLAQLGAKNATEAEIIQMATLTAAAPYIGNLTPAADANRIAQCINRADALGRVTAR
ncbi:GldA Glycerol dehydrogenase and related enzymes [Burkholderiaceae bacterium]